MHLIRKNIFFVFVLFGAIFTFPFYLLDQRLCIFNETIELANKVNHDSIQKSGFYSKKEFTLLNSKALRGKLLVGKSYFPFNNQTSLDEIRAINENKLMYISTSPVWHTPSGNFKKAISCSIADEQSGNTYYRTYFSEVLHNLPVIALTVNPNDLFNDFNGINVQGLNNVSNKVNAKWWDQNGNYQRKGKESERNCYFEFFDKDLNVLYSNYAGIRIHGNATRAFPQKSFRLSSKKVNGKKGFQFSFFNNQFYFEKDLVLRNGGNDWGRTFFADGLMQTLVHELNLEEQQFLPVVLYLNGEYWGVYSLRQKLDEDFLSNKYKIAKKEICFIESDHLNSGDENVYRELKAQIENLENGKFNGDETFNELNECIDIESFINYIIVETYFCNSDWPHNNCKYFKLDSQKWRWGIYDLDYGYAYLGNPKAYGLNMFDVIQRNNSFTARIFKLLLQSQAFVSKFKSKAKEILSGPLSKSNQNKWIQYYYNSYKNEIPRQIARWRKPATVDEWNYYVNEMKVFAKKREEVYLQQLNRLNN